MLEAVTEYDAECYSRFLRQQQGLGESTARKMVAIAKQILRSAVRARLITQNPFAEEKTTPPEKAEGKQYHVSDVEVQKVYQACPTTEWRAFLVLGRYAGLRLPSEMQPLKWECKRRWESVALGGRKVQRSGCGRSSWERGWRLATRCY